MSHQLHVHRCAIHTIVAKSFVCKERIIFSACIIIDVIQHVGSSVGRLICSTHRPANHYRMCDFFCRIAMTQRAMFDMDFKEEIFSVHRNSVKFPNAVYCLIPQTTLQSEFLQQMQRYAELVLIDSEEGRILKETNESESKHLLIHVLPFHPIPSLPPLSIPSLPTSSPPSLYPLPLPIQVVNEFLLLLL